MESHVEDNSYCQTVPLRKPGHDLVFHRVFANVTDGLQPNPLPSLHTAKTFEPLVVTKQWFQIPRRRRRKLVLFVHRDCRWQFWGDCCAHGKERVEINFKKMTLKKTTMCPLWTFCIHCSPSKKHSQALLTLWKKYVNVIVATAALTLLIWLALFSSLFMPYIVGVIVMWFAAMLFLGRVCFRSRWGGRDITSTMCKEGPWKLWVDIH